ncbi:MAG: 2-amino-4-hydroxy-6-hydroxymethyldihydropteridine pyrophosphokinase [Osedax symbiont Rs2]|nr:MAG: 2-amino-4-hydroxy-6-hydroxymethyldihydropteridine pyrophosphokinase [Osedax symbiont Rs2]
MTPETNNSVSRCYIGIGSNLADPLQQVNTAIVELQQLANCQWQGVSSLYRSAPVGPAGQDDYINAVACLETRLAPETLLDALQQLENAHQRERIQRWGARTLDLDILLIADQVIDTNRLIVPHPYITQRNFVLVPLLELAGDISIGQHSLRHLLENCPSGGLQKL